MKKEILIQTKRIQITIIILSVVWLLPLIGRTQEIVTRDNHEFIKIDVSEQSPFSIRLLLQELDSLSNAKVAISHEVSTIYIYPYDVSVGKLIEEVSEIIQAVSSKDLMLSADEKDIITSKLVANHGDWLVDYSATGLRSTENDSCHTALPFCTGTIYTFPGGVNTGSAQSGPNYSCLSTQPNPAWYYMKIDQPGNITIRMSSDPSRDIDFCLWGPFPDPYLPCPMNNSQGGLTSQKVVSCSYSPDDVENAVINGAQTGQYYILMITNYSNSPCEITFQKTSGSATTDCTILPPPASSNSPVCINNHIQLTAATAGGATYNWTGPNNFSSNLQNPVIPDAQYANSGTYSLTITVNGNTSEPTTTDVLVIDPPTAQLTAGSNTTFCYGDSVKLVVTATGIGPFTAQISGGGGIPASISFTESPGIIWLSSGASTTYTLTGISNAGCSGTASGSVAVIVRPVPTANFTSSNLCSGINTSFLDESTIASGTISEWNWDFGDGTPNSNLQDPTHIYTNPGNFNVTLDVTSNFGCSSSLTLPHVIKSTPNVNAGADKTINYGTITSLSGTASGGSGSHTYQWQPADKVVNSTSLNSNTQIIYEATQFTLTATDANGCQKSDEMQLSIIGGPLTCNIEVTYPEVCKGSSSTLKANSSGGAGPDFYEYDWVSEPAGFTSNLQEITVTPMQTTKYKVHIFDGYTDVYSDFTIVVNENPVVTAANDLSIPHGTSTILSCNVSGDHGPYQYQWSPVNFVETPNSQSPQTTNLYESRVFSVEVTDTKGCIHSDVMSVTITGDALSVAVQAESPICRNTPTTLISMVGGGNSGNETPTYIWTDQDGTFVSDEAQPIVSPDYTTTYTVKVNDGYNNAEGSFKVVVNQLPVIDLIPNDPKIVVINDSEPFSIGACVFDSILISAGNPGSSYQWSNGSVDEIITVSTSGIIYDEQSFDVKVTDPLTTCSNTAHLSVIFTFSNCSYGFEENDLNSGVNVYPNPNTDGVFKLTSSVMKNDVIAEVFNSQGKNVFTKLFDGTSSGELDEVIDLSSQPSGIYIMRLYNQNRAVIKKLIIK
jgi:PKD repeat protein